MQLRVRFAIGIAVLGVAGVSTAAIAHDRSRFQTALTGYEELPTLSTDGNGFFKASLNRAGTELRYELTYSGPFNANPSGGTVTQAHIHFGARAFSGGIAAFLCTNLNNGPAGTPACPPTEGTVTGVITMAQVVGPAGQGIAPGEFGELVRAIRTGATYANIHTTTFPPGEVRGQIDGDDDDHH
jgi:hypothetical protein